MYELCMFHINIQFLNSLKRNITNVSYAAVAFAKLYTLFTTITFQELLILLDWMNIDVVLLLLILGINVPSWTCFSFFVYSYFTGSNCVGYVRFGSRWFIDQCCIHL